MRRGGRCDRYRASGRGILRRRRPDDVGQVGAVLVRQAVDVRLEDAALGCLGRPVVLLYARAAHAVVVDRVGQRLDAPAGADEPVVERQVLQADAVLLGEAAGGFEDVPAHQGTRVAHHVGNVAPGAGGADEADGVPWEAVSARGSPSPVKRMLAAGTQSASAKRAARTKRETASGNRTLSSSRNSSHSPRAARAAVLRAAPT